MNKLTESQTEIFTNYNTRGFGVWEVWGDLYGVLKRHGNRTKYYIYKSLCKYNGTIIENCNNKLVCEINCKRNYSLFNDINKDCYIKVLKRAKFNALLNRKYDDKIVMKFIVCK